MAVNWGLLGSGQQGGDIADYFQRSRQLDNQRMVANTAAAKQQADLVEAARVRTELDKAATAYQAGDDRGATSSFIRSGEEKFIAPVNTTANDMQTRGIKSQTFLGGIANSLLASTDENHLAERTQFIEHNRPVWKQLGISDDQITQLSQNPTNLALQGLTRSGYDVKDQDANVVAIQNATTGATNAETGRLNALTGQATEARLAATPIGINPESDVYTPGSARPPANGQPNYNITVGGGTANLTGMSLGQAINYGRTVLIPQTRGNAQLGLKKDEGSSAMGAFQITQGTLQTYGPKVFGQNWQSTPFTPENQEKLAEAIYNDKKGGNLKATWQGLTNSTPGAYRNVPWSKARQEIIGAESTPGYNSAPTLIHKGKPKDDGVVAHDPGLELAANQYVMTGEMPPLGNGSGPYRKAILDRSAQILNERFGGDQSKLAGNRAQYKALNKSLGTLVQQRGTAAAAEGTALTNGEIFLEMARKVPGANGPVAWNAIVNGVAKQFGSTAVQNMDSAYTTFITEYAKVTTASPSGAGQLSDSARHEAMDTLSSNASLDQKVSAMEVLKRDMKSRINSIDAETRRVQSKISGLLGAKTRSREDKANAGVQATKSIGGKTYYKVNGAWYDNAQGK